MTSTLHGYILWDHLTRKPLVAADDDQALPEVQLVQDEEDATWWEHQISEYRIQRGTTTMPNSVVKVAAQLQFTPPEKPA